MSCCVTRFGQKYVDRVANPKDIVQFHRQKAHAADRKTKDGWSQILRVLNLTKPKRFIWKHRMYPSFSYRNIHFEKTLHLNSVYDLRRLPLTTLPHYKGTVKNMVPSIGQGVSSIDYNTTLFLFLLIPLTTIYQCCPTSLKTSLI